MTDKDTCSCTHYREAHLGSAGMCCASGCACFWYVFAVAADPVEVVQAHAAPQETPPGPEPSQKPPRARAPFVSHSLWEVISTQDWTFMEWATIGIDHNRLVAPAIRKALSTLSDRERGVLELRFGLVDGSERTLEEVGQRFAVTRERIRQIEASALRKLRHPSRSRQLRHLIPPQ